MIDAEGEYEGKYAAADRYIRALRARDRRRLPALARRLPLRRLPPGLPLLGLLRPRRRPVQPAADVLEGDRHLGARRLRAHLPLQPRLGAPDLPDRADLRRPRRAAQILRFRRFADSYGGLPPSWWDWQETNTAELGGARRDRRAGAGRRLPPDHLAHPLLKRGSRGDLVVWAQEHLVGAGQTQLPVTGIFGKQTTAAVRAFQRAHGLRGRRRDRHRDLERAARVEPVRPRWAARRREAHAQRRRGAARRGAPPAAPLSASLPAKAYEIDPGPAP